MKTIEERMVKLTEIAKRSQPAGEPKNDEGAPVSAYFDAMAEAAERTKTDPEFAAAMRELHQDAVLDLG